MLAAVDEPSADERFVEEVQANDPDSEVFLDGPGMVAYLTPFQGTSPEVEPVWYATRNVRSTSGVVGRPQPASLSLTDPNAPIVPYAPPD